MLYEFIEQFTEVELLLFIYFFGMLIVHCIATCTKLLHRLDMYYDPVASTLGKFTMLFVLLLVYPVTFFVFLLVLFNTGEKDWLYNRLCRKTITGEDLL